MKKLWLIPLSIILLISCEKDDDPKSQELPLASGIYRGTFNRTGMDTVDVSLTITDNRFQGQGSSSSQYYPAICRGSFTGNEHAVTFQDSCAWTANFDWSLILNGRFEISVNDRNVRMWKNNGSSTDEYILTRLER